MVPLIHEITDILGPFIVTDLELHETGEEWDGAYTDAYEVPEHLRVDGSGRHFGKPLTRVVNPVQNIESRSVQDVLGQEVALTSSKRKEALTQALAYTHSRGK